MNRYEIWFGEKIGDATSIGKALDIADEILDTIKKYPNPEEPDEYTLLQIRCFNWIDRLFGIKDPKIKRIPGTAKLAPIRHTIIVWSEVEKKYVISKQ